MAPMTIHEAKALAASDLAIGDDAVALAEAEAQEAAQLVEALERRAVEGKDKPTSGAAAAEAVALADFAIKRAARTRQLADRARAAKRLLALDAVASDVKAIHAAGTQGAAGMIAAMQQIAGARAALQELADAHNAKVGAAISRAFELSAEPAAPSGPRSSSAYIAVAAGGKIQSGSAVVQKVGRRDIDDAVALALRGDPDAAVARLHAAHTVAPPERRDVYFTAGNGQVHGQDEPLPPALAKRIAKGEYRVLSDDEVEAFLAGQYDGHQHQAQA